jgi:hypothetical protein
VIGPEIIGNWVVAALVGVSASVITQVRYSRRDKKAATYLAMRIAISLEAFVIACSDLIGENERAQRGDDEEGPRRSLPELGAYPDSDDWQTLDVEFANRVLALRNDLTVSNNTLFFEWDIGDAAQSDVCDNEAAKRGVQAWDLACALRSNYKLAHYSPGYDIRGRLQKHIYDAQAAEDARRTATQVMFDEILTGEPSSATKEAHL